MISGLILIIIAIFLPPVAVFLISGCGADLLINIGLTLLGYFPGHIHAFYLIYRRHERNKGRKYQGQQQQQQPQGVYGQPQQQQYAPPGAQGLYAQQEQPVYRDEQMQGQGYGTVKT